MTPTMTTLPAGTSENRGKTAMYSIFLKFVMKMVEMRKNWNRHAAAAQNP
jgi:hypothetical protein